MTRALYDEGLQPERTELAWRRTALSFGVAALLGFRLLSEAFGEPSWSLGVLFATVLSGAVWVLSGRRSRRITRVLLDDRVRDLPSGVLLFAVAMSTVAVAVGAFVATFVVVTSR